ncbi:MAG TPA: hypothetical protein VF463_11785 [Sphingobium sp.]
MLATTVVQTRPAPNLAALLDSHAAKAGITRAEVVRVLLETALNCPSPAPAMVAGNPLLAEIAEEMGALISRVEACEASARSAHAAARLGALMLLPQTSWDSTRPRAAPW